MTRYRVAVSVSLDANIKTHHQ